MILRRLIPYAVLALILMSAFFAYEPGLTGTFVFDDYNNLVLNPHLHFSVLTLENLLQAAYSGSSGMLGRPLSMTTFALNLYAAGPDAAWFKLTNLFIHMVNGGGIYVLSLVLLDVYRRRFAPALTSQSIRLVALAVCAAWVLHPLNLTSVLYVVQRMTSLSALFVIWGLALFVWGRLRLCEGRGGYAAVLAALVVFTPLATLSKENGILLPGFMLAVELTLFRFEAPSRRARLFVVGLFLLAVAMPAVIALTWLAFHPKWILNGYRFRDFTLGERLGTEARVIWGYMQQILAPDIRKLGLYQDAIPLSRSLFQPASTLPAALGIVGLFGLAAWARTKAPLLSLGLLLFLLGHSLESSVIPLEIAFEHRNYFPMFGLLLILFYYLLVGRGMTEHPRLRQIAAILLIGFLAYMTHVRATAWSNPFDLVTSELRNHPDSVRANTDMADLYDRMQPRTPQDAEINYRNGRHFYERTVALDPANTNGLLSLIILSSSHGKPLEAEWAVELQRRLQTAPQSPIIGSRLVFLVRCQEAGTCKLSRDELESVLQAPLQNRTLTELNRAEVRYAWAVYLINIRRDYDAARKVMYDMAAGSSDPQHRLTLVKFLIALGDHEAAATQLAILKKNSGRSIYRPEILKQEKRLSEMRAKQAVVQPHS